MSRLPSLLPFASIFFLFGCVKPCQYRFVSAPAAKTCMAALPALLDRGIYKIAYVEYNDAGLPWDTTQLDTALAAIREAKQHQGRVLVLTYIHGWKNSAAPAPTGKKKDVEKFTTAVRRLADLADKWRVDGRPMPVVGVYLAWRGGEWNVPSYASWPTFWTRRKVAKRLGGNIAPNLDRLVAETKKDSPDSRFLLVGHSFGSLIAEHGMSATSHVTKALAAPPKSEIRPEADMVLFVNSANDGVLSARIMNELRQKQLVVRHPAFDSAFCRGAGAGGDPRCQPYPLLIAVTSRADMATKLLLPIAGLFPSGDREKGTASFARHSAGHTRTLHSHDVEETFCEEGKPEGATFMFRTVGAPATCYAVGPRVKLEGEGEIVNQTPFWIMATESTVMKDHGDIWNLSFMNLLFGLVGELRLVQP